MSRIWQAPPRRTRALLAGVVASFLAPLVTEAQPATKSFSIGYLVAVTPEVVAPYSAAIEEGLRDLGYVEGRNMVVHRRYAEGKPERLPDLAAELVRLKVAVIVATTNTTIAAAKRATRSIPIIMVIAAENAGRRLGIAVRSVEIRGLDDFEAAFATMVRERADGVVPVSVGPVAFTRRRHILGLAAQAKLPAVHMLREWVDEGGLMSYGPSLIDLWRRSATFVDKILRGAKPGDLPVEQPTKFELVINLKAAKALGFTVPQSLLLRADEVIQ